MMPNNLTAVGLRDATLKDPNLDEMPACYMHAACMLYIYCLGHSWMYGTINTDGWISDLCLTRGASSVPVT